MTTLLTTFERPRLDEPLVVLTYAYSGVARLRGLLEYLPGLAWITTDLVKSCGQLAANWQEIEDHGDTFSRIAQASIKSLFNTMITTRLTASGATRYSIPTNSSSRETERFALLYPGARFLCLHRMPLDVIYTAIAANPWGLAGSPCARFAQLYPGNSVAAGADYWAQQTDQMLAFERAFPERTLRIKYEELDADPAATTRSIGAFIGMTDSAGGRAPTIPWPGQTDMGSIQAASTTVVGCGSNVPVNRIPDPLLATLNELLGQLSDGPLTG